MSSKSVRIKRFFSSILPITSDISKSDDCASLVITLLASVADLNTFLVKGESVPNKQALSIVV